MSPWRVCPLSGVRDLRSPVAVGAGLVPARRAAAPTGGGTGPAPTATGDRRVRKGERGQSRDGGIHHIAQYVHTGYSFVPKRIWSRADDVPACRKRPDRRRTLRRIGFGGPFGGIGFVSCIRPVFTGEA